MDWSEFDLEQRLKALADDLVGETITMVPQADLDVIVAREFSDRLDPAFEKVAEMLAEVIRDVTGRRVLADYYEHKFVGEWLHIMVKFNLFDMESGAVGLANIVAMLDADKRGTFHLKPVVSDLVRVTMYGGDTDRQIEKAIMDRLSKVSIEAFTLAELLFVVATSYNAEVLEYMRRHEETVREVLAEALNVRPDEVTARLFNVEVSPEAMMGLIHFLFRSRDANTGAVVSGRLTFAGIVVYMEGTLRLGVLDVNIVYKVDRQEQESG